MHLMHGGLVESVSRQGHGGTAMSDNTSTLESLQTEFIKGAREHGELRYFLLEGNEDGFPNSALVERADELYECREVFRIGDHMGAHVLCGSRAAIETFRRLSNKVLGFVPIAYQQTHLGKSDYSDIRWLNAILALDSRIGTKKYGVRRVWFEYKNSDGAIEKGVSGFLPGSTKFEQQVLVPASFREGLERRGSEILKVVRTQTVHDIFAAAFVGIDQLLLRQRMPPYFDDLRPTYTELVKLVWEIEDLVAAVRNAGLTEASPAQTLGSEGDCGFMLAASLIRRYLNPNDTPWSKLNFSTSGWNSSVFEALRCLVKVMERVYASQGWHDLSQLSISSDRSKIPRIDGAIPRELAHISEVLRRDGLEALPRDAVSLGTPQLAAKLSRPRVFIDDIDSFAEVGRISAADVSDLLDDAVYLDMLENDIQVALEAILAVPFHKKDWPGEENDLYADIKLDGKRIAAAFALNGRGKANGMRILHPKHCGKNGDQIGRLFQSPAQLFVIQFVGEVAEAVIKEMEEKAMYRQLRGQEAHYCVINGQDTARLLRAYGKR